MFKVKKLFQLMLITAFSACSSMSAPILKFYELSGKLINQVPVEEFVNMLDKFFMSEMNDDDLNKQRPNKFDDLDAIKSWIEYSGDMGWTAYCDKEAYLYRRFRENFKNRCAGLPKLNIAERFPPEEIEELSSDQMRFIHENPYLGEMTIDDDLRRLFSNLVKIFDILEIDKSIILKTSQNIPESLQSLDMDGKISMSSPAMLKEVLGEGKTIDDATTLQDMLQLAKGGHGLYERKIETFIGHYTELWGLPKNCPSNITPDRSHLFIPEILRKLANAHIVDDEDGR